ncbi:peptide ABC transporter substrate-binding protein [Eubacteriales bacterium OttesenSCG-928-A19]|nr:peptide ABC transporter substrate-binding protein [Eubacteriales bacterium OttesenSCG-928-A19]
MRRTLAILLCLVMTLSSSLALASEASGIAAEQVFRKVYVSEVDTWDYLYNSAGTEYGDLVDCLIENDTYGMPQPCVAESWEVSEDGTVYTFHIRPGIKWYTHTGEEYGEVTAHDFVFSAKTILTADYGSKTSDILTGFFVNADEYFSGNCEWEDVGVKALDDYTLEYTLIGPISYFLSNLTYVCFIPCNEQFFNECGDKWATSNEYLLYNGGYIMTDLQPQVGRTLVKNENYWDAENIHLERQEYIFNSEASTLGPVMVQTGEAHEADIPGGMLDSWISDPALASMLRPIRPGNSPYSSYSYFYMFNFWPTFDEEIGGSHDTWTTVVNNENFRKSFFHALDRVGAMETQDPYSPEIYINNTITLPDFVSANGVSYSQMGDLAAFANTDSFDPALALEFKAKAMEELAAEGIEFPVTVYCPYNSSSTEWTNRAQVVEQQMEATLGEDYIDIVIDGYPSTDFLNVTRRAGNYAWMECYWGADFQDPGSYCDPFRLGQKYNYMWYGDGMAEETTEDDPEGRLGFDGKYWKNYIYDEMYDEANAEQVDMEKRYLALANLEAWLIDTGIVTPYAIGGVGYMSSYLNPFEQITDYFGISRGKHKHQYLYNAPMGLDEYEEAMEKWQAEYDELIAGGA